MNILCQIKDHRWDENASAYGVEYCTRCQREFPHYPGSMPPGAFTLRRAIEYRLWHIKGRITSVINRIRNRFSSQKTDDIPF